MESMFFPATLSFRPKVFDGLGNRSAAGLFMVLVLASFAVLGCSLGLKSLGEKE